MLGLRIWGFRVLMLLIGASFAGPAAARRMMRPGSAGFGWPNSSKNCFQNSWAEMRNNCSDRRLLIVPMPAYAVNHTYQVQVIARGSGYVSPHDDTSCYVVECDENNACTTSATKHTVASGAVTLSFDPFFIEDRHTLQVECWVARLNSPRIGAVIEVVYAID